MAQQTTPPLGSVIRAISGTRPISVTVVGVSDDGVTMRCNPDWSFQGGACFTVSHDKFPGTCWGKAVKEAA